MHTVDTDALVIGSGFGAAAVARRLAEAGATVTIVEKGPGVGPSDFRQTQDPRYITRYLKGLSGDHLHLTFAEALGGGSGFYEMVSLRAPSSAFDQVDRSGRRLWPEPLDRRELDPWYDLAERELGVNQIPESEVPNERALPACASTASTTRSGARPRASESKVGIDPVQATRSTCGIVLMHDSQAFLQPLRCDKPGNRTKIRCAGWRWGISSYDNGWLSSMANVRKAPYYNPSIARLGTHR